MNYRVVSYEVVGFANLVRVSSAVQCFLSHDFTYLSRFQSLSVGSCNFTDIRFDTCDSESSTGGCNYKVTHEVKPSLTIDLFTWDLF